MSSSLHLTTPKFPLQSMVLCISFFFKNVSERETERQRDRETERQRDRERQRETERHRETDIETDRDPTAEDIGRNERKGIYGRT